MSGFYNAGKQALLERTIPPEAGLFAVGVNDEYLFDSAHTDFAVLSPYILLPETELSNLSFTDGILKADNPKWFAAGTGIEDRSLVLKGIVLYFLLADEGALLAYLDSATVGLPQTLTGVNVTGNWNPNGILKL